MPALLALILMGMGAFVAPDTCGARLDCAINEARIADGLPPLRGSVHLAIAAQAHAEELARRMEPLSQPPSHTGLNGSRPAERAVAAGYPSAYVGELTVIRPTASGALEAFLGSPRHAAAVFDTEHGFADIGIGAAVGADQRVAWVVLLGAER